MYPLGTQEKAIETESSTWVFLWEKRKIPPVTITEGAETGVGLDHNRILRWGGDFSATVYFQSNAQTSAHFGFEIVALCVFSTSLRKTGAL